MIFTWLINNNIKEFKFGIDIIDLKTGSLKESVLQVGCFANVGNGDIIDFLSTSEELRDFTQKKWVTIIRYPFILFIFRSFTSFFILTTSVFTLSISLSIFPILSFISVKFFVISLFAAIDSFITGTIYL